MSRNDLSDSGSEFGRSCCSMNSESVVYWAVKRNHIKVIEALIYDGAQVTLEMIAEAAATFDRLDILKYMFFLGAQPSYKILKQACSRGSNTVFQFMHGVCRCWLTRDDIQQLVKHACEGGHIQMVQDFIMLYPDILKNHWWKLIYICEKGYFDIVKLLVEEGNADVHQSSDYSVLCAIKGGHLDLVKYLVSRGADLFAQGDYAIEHVEYEDVAMLEYLLEQGANKAKIPRWYKLQTIETNTPEKTLWIM